MSGLRGFAAQREALLAIIVLAMIVLVVLRAPEYLDASNIANLMVNWGLLSILVLGQLAVLLTRGIDLSQAAVLALVGMLLALLSEAAPWLPAPGFIVLALAAGALLGLVNGLAIAFVKLPPIIMTLGTLTIYRGLIYVLSNGAWVSAHEMSDRFKAFPARHFLGLPDIIWTALVCAALFGVMLRATRTGRDIYAFGGNPEAARYAGISAARIEVLVYALSGAVAGLCGYLWTGRFAIAYTQAAEGREFAIIAACVIGGVSIAGGRGTMIGAVLGALFIAVLETALPFLRISPFFQTGVIGAVILIAVAVNARAERRPGRRILAPAAAGATTP